MAKRVRPVGSEFYVTSGFGPRWGTVHRGTDFGRNGGSANAPVYAAQGGTVQHSGAASGFGGPSPAGWVVIDHPTADGSGTTVYGHVISEVRVGQRVEAGQRIARINPHQGSNGGVAPHLHFEVHRYVWSPGAQIDPVPWLNQAAAPSENQGGNTMNWKQRYPNTLLGIDVSEHQDGMSLKQAAREGVDYFILRTTDGTYRDRTYASHFDDAKGTGKPMAAYHYLRNPSEGTTVAQQVQASVDVMGHRKLPMWLDCETPAGLHENHIRDAQREFEARGIRVIGCYSYVPYWENSIAPREPKSAQFGAFWVAAYPNSVRTNPAEVYSRIGGDNASRWTYPLGDQRPVMWQFTSSGVVCGRGVDCNAFKGNITQLRELFEGKKTVAQPQPEPIQPTPAPQGITSLIDPRVHFRTQDDLLAVIDAQNWRNGVMLAKLLEIQGVNPTELIDDAIAQVRGN